MAGLRAALFVSVSESLARTEVRPLSLWERAGVRGYGLVRAAPPHPHRILRCDATSPCRGEVNRACRQITEKLHVRQFHSYFGAWQWAQVPVISTTESFGAKPEARAALFRLCATAKAGISPTEPQRSQIRNATIEAVS